MRSAPSDESAKRKWQRKPRLLLLQEGKKEEGPACFSLKRERECCHSRGEEYSSSHLKGNRRKSHISDSGACHKKEGAPPEKGLKALPAIGERGRVRDPEKEN